MLKVICELSMNTPRCFGKMKHRAKNARCYTAIMFVIETSNRQAGMVQPRAAAALLGRFLWSCSKKASQTPKGKPLATVSHDHAATQPGTVSYRAERTCVSAQPSSADACNVGIRCSDDVMLQHIPRKGRRGRRPLQSVCAAQPTYTHHPSAVREASPRSAMHKYPLTKLPLPVC